MSNKRKNNVTCKGKLIENVNKAKPHAPTVYFQLLL
jgi:hypothetical protein